MSYLEQSDAKPLVAFTSLSSRWKMTPEGQVLGYSSVIKCYPHIKPLTYNLQHEDPSVILPHHMTVSLRPFTIKKAPEIGKQQFCSQNLLLQFVCVSQMTIISEWVPKPWADASDLRTTDLTLHKLLEPFVNYFA